MVGSFLALLGIATSIHAQSSSSSDQTELATSSPAEDVRVDVPVMAFTHSAFGTRARKFGAHGFGSAQWAEGGSLGRGGLTAYGSPFDRLTLLATGERRLDGRYGPSASLAYRVLGSVEQGWSLAAMGTYKAEGFAQVEGEIELGALFSVARGGWHLDVNGVAGGGLEASEEFDSEMKLRAGYDATDWLTVGFDGRGRYRLRGPLLLAGGRNWYVIGGPQVTASWSRFYGSALVGPTTVGIGSGVGAVSWLTVGGVLP